jgi:hypothetical protein
LDLTFFYIFTASKKRIAPTSGKMDNHAFQWLNRMKTKRYITLGHNGFDLWRASTEEDFMGKVNI